VEWSEDGVPWVGPEAHEGTAALVAGTAAGVPPYPLEHVIARPSDAAGQDSAYAHCLGCGRHAGGRRHRGFSASGPAGHVERLARAHTAETGHPTRMRGPDPVTEFFIAEAR
jgi:hypothetical protein